MESEDIKFIGYWNGDKENPELLFSIPKDIDKYQLVVITLDLVKASLKDYCPSKELNEINKLSRGLKKVAESMRKIKYVK